ARTVPPLVRRGRRGGRRAGGDGSRHRDARRRAVAPDGAAQGRRRARPRLLHALLLAEGTGARGEPACRAPLPLVAARSPGARRGKRRAGHGGGIGRVLRDAPARRAARGACLPAERSARGTGRAVRAARGARGRPRRGAGAAAVDVGWLPARARGMGVLATSREPPARPLPLRARRRRLARRAALPVARPSPAPLVTLSSRWQPLHVGVTTSWRECESGSSRSASLAASARDVSVTVAATARGDYVFLARG